MVNVNQIPVRILGREIGTASGWDEAGSMCSMQFYDFKPSDGVAIAIVGRAKAVLYIDYDADLWELYCGEDDDNREVTAGGSIVALVTPLHVAEHTGG